MEWLSKEDWRIHESNTGEMTSSGTSTSMRVTLWPCEPFLNTPILSTTCMHWYSRSAIQTLCFSIQGQSGQPNFKSWRHPWYACLTTAERNVLGPSSRTEYVKIKTRVIKTEVVNGKAGPEISGTVHITLCGHVFNLDIQTSVVFCIFSWPKLSSACLLKAHSNFSSFTSIAGF